MLIDACQICFMLHRLLCSHTSNTKVKMAGVYTKSQIAQFLAHLGLDPSQYVDRDFARDFSTLSTLQTHMLSTVPYENLSIHYSQDHSIVLDPQILFDKIVTSKRGRGGYCMETNLLYHYMLRGLGFRTYLAGVRMRTRVEGVPQGPYSGWCVSTMLGSSPTT